MPKKKSDKAIAADMRRIAHSRLVHIEAIRMIEAGEIATDSAKEAVGKWLQRPESGCAYSALMRRWREILNEERWGEVVADSEDAVLLRAASPLTFLVPGRVVFRLRVRSAIESIQDPVTS